LRGRISKSGPVFYCDGNMVAVACRSPLALGGHKLDRRVEKQKLILPVAPLHRIDELLRVEADTVFEDDLDILDI